MRGPASTPASEIGHVVVEIARAMKVGPKGAVSDGSRRRSRSSAAGVAIVRRWVITPPAFCTASSSLDGTAEGLQRTTDSVTHEGREMSPRLC